MPASRNAKMLYQDYRQYEDTQDIPDRDLGGQSCRQRMFQRPLDLWTAPASCRLEELGEPDPSGQAMHNATSPEGRLHLNNVHLVVGRRCLLSCARRGSFGHEVLDLVGTRLAALLALQETDEALDRVLDLLVALDLVRLAHDEVGSALAQRLATGER